MTLKHKERETVTDLLEGALEMLTCGAAQQKISKALSILKKSNKKNEETEKLRAMRFKSNYGRTNPMSETSRCLNALCNTMSLVEFAREDLKLANKLQGDITQDMLHAVEFLDEESLQMNEMYSQLRLVRKQRRIAKDFLESVKPLYKLAVKHEDVRKDLAKALSEIQKIQKLHKERVYTPRAIIGLGKAFDEAKQKELTT